MFSVKNQERLNEKIGLGSSFARAIFEAWDLDGDGELTREEMRIGLKELIADDENDVTLAADELMGGDRDAVAAIADKILIEVDNDHSGTLSMEEFEVLALKAIQKFLPGYIKMNRSKNDE